jgi:hypothetical protein
MAVEPVLEGVWICCCNNSVWEGITGVKYSEKGVLYTLKVIKSFKKQLLHLYNNSRHRQLDHAISAYSLQRLERKPDIRKIMINYIFSTPPVTELAKGNFNFNLMQAGIDRVFDG